jgi:phosphatidate cytidylyltransferase
MLKTRLITAAIIIPIALVAIWFLPFEWFSLLATLIVAAIAWEWSAVVKIEHWVFRAIYTAIVIAGIVLTFYIPIIYWFAFAVLLWFWAFVAILLYANNKGSCGFGSPVIKAIMGFLVLLPFWMSLNILRNTSLGPILLIFALVLIWSVDTGAYFAGRYLGKRKLIERVSPNKTWEGFFGGVVLCVLIAIIYALIRGLVWQQVLISGALGLLTALYSVIGDLFESMLKRQVGIKDSGNILPGHGGFLDRFDSAIAALPLFTLGILLFGS